MQRKIGKSEGSVRTPKRIHSANSIAHMFFHCSPRSVTNIQMQEDW
jgi:hypothetical protein